MRIFAKWILSILHLILTLLFPAQRGCPIWEMLLWPVEWFTVSTNTAAKPLPSILLMTPRQGNSGFPTYSSQTSMVTTPWWTTTPGKECCTLGTTNVLLLTLSPLRNSKLVQNLKGKQNQAMDVKLFDLLLCRCTCERNKLTLQLAFLRTDQSCRLKALTQPFCLLMARVQIF